MADDSNRSRSLINRILGDLGELANVIGSSQNQNVDVGQSSNPVEDEMKQLFHTRGRSDGHGPNNITTADAASAASTSRPSRTSGAESMSNTPSSAYSTPELASPLPGPAFPSPRLGVNSPLPTMQSQRERYVFGNTTSRSAPAVFNPFIHNRSGRGITTPYSRKTNKQLKTAKNINTKVVSGNFTLDLVLMGGPDELTVPLQAKKQLLVEEGHLLYGWKLCKEYSALQVINALRDAFASHIPADAKIKIMVSVNKKLVTPPLGPGQELDGVMCHKLFKGKPLYLLPDINLLKEGEDVYVSDSELLHDPFDDPELAENRSCEQEESWKSSKTDNQLTSAAGTNKVESKWFGSLKAEIKWLTPHSYQFPDHDSMKIMSVRRKNLWMDGMKKISLFYPTLSQESPFIVQFVGESGADYGGPKREFFAEMMRLAENELMQGSDRKLTFQRDSGKLHAKMYESYGKLISLSFLYGFPGPKCFAPTLVSYILGHDIGDSTIEEIPDFEARSRISVISEAKDDLMLNLSLSTFDERFDAGLNKVSYAITEKPEVVKDMIYHYVVSKQLEEVQQFKKGLELMSVFSALQNHPNEACKEFLFTGLSASNVFSSFSPEYSCDEKKREMECDIVFNFNNFLDELEAGPSWNSFKTIVDLESEAEEVIQLNLHDVLQFICGSRHIASGGMSGKLMFLHDTDHGKRVQVNTCIVNITFPVTARYTISESFNKNFGEDIICSPGFGQV
eukprot:gene8209-9089_t